MRVLCLLTGIMCFLCARTEEESSTQSRSMSTDNSENSITTDAEIPRYRPNFRSSTPSGQRSGVYRRRNYFNPMPECAAQQVCNAVFMRLKFVQPLCKCSRSFQDSCSTKMNPYDGHTINLISDRDGSKTQTLVKVCEDVSNVKTCGDPHDWMLLALQNVRTGKAHYLVVCRCPASAVMEGPVLHTNPPYARIPGISVYGMLCVQGARKSRLHKEDYPPVPWEKIYDVYNTTWAYRDRRKYPFHGFEK